MLLPAFEDQFFFLKARTFSRLYRNDGRMLDLARSEVLKEALLYIFVYEVLKMHKEVYYKRKRASAVVKESKLA